MGRLVLVNAVLDCQLIYHMSALLLAPGIIKKVDQRRRGFLWSGAGQTNGAKCLVAWDDVQKNRCDGGLGVKDMPTQNTCLLLKLLHRLHTSSSSSWAAWVRGHTSLAMLKGALKGDHWEVLRSLLPIYRAITTSSVGDGRATSFWHDAWEGCDDLATRFSVLLSHVKEQEVSVRDVIEKGLPNMLVPRLTVQAGQELQEVLGILQNVHLSDEPDVRECFAATADNKLQSGMVYQVLRGGGAVTDEGAGFIWKCRAPPRVQFFGWLALRGRLQCRANLVVKGVVPDDVCVACRDEVETSTHILFQCRFAVQFWSLLHIGTPASSPRALLHLLRRPHDIPALHFNTFALLCCWNIWKRRNKIIFEGVPATMSQFLGSVRAEAALWRHRLKVENRWLSQYCAYLVSCYPELLPDNNAWCKRLYKAAKKDTKRAVGECTVSGSSTPEDERVVADEHHVEESLTPEDERPIAQMYMTKSSTPEAEYYEKLVVLLSANSNHEVVKNGVKLGKQLVETTRDSGEDTVVWKLLAGFWSEMVLYVAPSDNLKGHKEAIARGGELITLLWALLFHAGIVSRPGEEDGAAPTTASSGA
ncbi:hypothetical protein U9M48_011599, partial [Paspalum notatum var. saurae]